LSAKRDTILAAIREQGVIRAAALSEFTGLPLDHIRYYLRELKTEGCVEPTVPRSTAKNQMYRLVGPDA
jgi:predicted transcriptional regulator